ncbi:MAG: type 4b pilus protein PilO2 [Desulfovibrionaceae bacterium]|nr:type 4b pilus protein PilO2 [Desulfovibrionaceae bacterium]
MRSITLHNRKYAVGIQWFLSNRKLKTSELRQEARHDESFDMVVFRQRQYGFGSSGGDIRPWRGRRALAAALQVPSPSFLGLFCLEDETGPYWWVFASAQGLILGMGDQAFTSQIEAESWIKSLRGLMDADFEETVTCETPVDSLNWLSPFVPSLPFALPSRRRGSLHPLHPVPSQRRNRIVIAAALGILFLGGYGLKLFFDQRAASQAKEAARTAMLNKEQRRREIQAHPEVHFPRPWREASDVRSTLQAIIPVMLSLPTVASGWVIEGAAYDSKTNQISASWGHRPGADYIRLPPSASLETPQKAVTKIAIPQIHQLQGDALFMRETASQRLYQSTQVIGGRLKLSWHSPERKSIEGIEIISPWQRGQWELSDVPAAIILDQSFPEAFTGLPGLILEQIFQDKEGRWSLKGVVYANPE